MNLDKPVPTAARSNRELIQANSQRGTFLDVLGLTLSEKYALSCSVLPREGGTVLHVLHPGRGAVEIGCEMTPDGWWFRWAAGERCTIAPVEALTGTAEVVAHHLRHAPGIIGFPRG